MKEFPKFLIVNLLTVLALSAREEVQQWHTLTLNFTGPHTAETATPNPFLDYRLDVTFRLDDREVVVPGYYAADGQAAQSSADAGEVWQVKFAPPSLGEWTWEASFRKGEKVAVANHTGVGKSAGFFDGQMGSFTVVPSRAKAPDFRARGTLEFVGTRYPRTIGDRRVFLKCGVDAPENLLSYADFDGDFKSDGIKDQLVKNWEPHVRDWQPGDPTWAKGKGKGLIGAVNYLASKRLNAISFLTLNIEGDDRNVFPYLNYQERERLDVSRLAQWELLFAHATSKGLFLHFKTQETENERLLDDGHLGIHRKLYYRELIARFSHHPALNWNMGEENGVWKNHPEKKSQSKAQRLAMARYFRENDPYRHPIVIHNGQWFGDLYGPNSPYTGASIQTSQRDFKWVHGAILRVLKESKKAGRLWHAACDEPGDAGHSLLPDTEDPDHDAPRQNALWGAFLAGGWGIEWYFGYQHPHSDLTCQDFRVRDRMWDQCGHALHFFQLADLPLDQMENYNKLLQGADGYCLAQPGEVYVILIKSGSPPARLHLSPGNYSLRWFNPRAGGSLQKATTSTLQGGNEVSLGQPPADPDKDWVALVRRTHSH